MLALFLPSFRKSRVRLSSARFYAIIRLTNGELRGLNVHSTGFRLLEDVAHCICNAGVEIVLDDAYVLEGVAFQKGVTEVDTRLLILEHVGTPRHLNGRE